MPMVWDATAHAKLFALVIKIHQVKLDYTALAEGMGEGCTPKAITHQIAKIKAGNGLAGNGRSAPATPASAAKKSIKATPKSTNNKRKHTNDEEEEDDEPVNTPSRNQSAKRRSVSAKPGQLADMDNEVDGDDEDFEDRASKKVKAEDDWAE